MSLGGTASYESLPTPFVVPGLVLRALELATNLGFELCVRPEIGRLLGVLAGGLAPGSLVGETGTGTGAGLAWMVSAAHPDVRFISYELDPDRAAAATGLFSEHANVEIVSGDAAGLFERGPFNLLVHDGGGGSGKHPYDTPIDPAVVLKPGATMTIDDYTPATAWPPAFKGEPDAGRIAWLTHSNLYTTEIQVASDLAVLVARYLP
ncbi:MAG: hypothetical protein V3V01_03865 [Acidimicrobiales bacterium]